MVRKGVRERKREEEREREKERKKETERERNREREKQREREGETKRERQRQKELYCSTWRSAAFLFLRTVQYGAKLVSWLMEQQNVDNSTLQRVKRLESSISTARKCEHFRIQ